MAVCPKCNQPVDDGLDVCPACGQRMPTRSSGTLDADQLFAAEEQTGDQSQPPSPPAAAPTADDRKPASDDAHGTLGAPEYKSEPLSSEPAAEAAPDKPLPADAAAGSAERLTVRGPDSEPAADTARKTKRYEDVDATIAAPAGVSGTAGKLRRMWKGAAGSSANPMHTLKGEGGLATDSVFARIARRVLVTDDTEEIVAGVSKAESQPEERARVEECIAIACGEAVSELADYNLTGFLGKGGMGVVLKARQKAIGRDVAIKMIQPTSGGSRSSTNEQKRKFFYEAQITGKLDHPNIVPIYDLGVSNEVLFYSMKMIIGTEWREAMPGMTKDENLDVLMKVADAMAFAHQKSVIHRDLKPDNVMLGPFGEVLVTDWGCAVDLSSNEIFSLAGSPPWMAPEMAMHTVNQIGPRSDIYLLGAMLYQIIAGYPPHPGQDAMQVLMSAAKNVIIPVDTADPLLDIAYRAMQTEPDERYPSVEDMQVAIREYRRHTESITLSDRSAALLEQAIESKDYERFSRTLFGFQDAIELWPGNTTAVARLGDARLAYGQAAFDKGDYDLCLQTLDTSVPVESELHAKATKAKKAAESQKKRFKTLRRVLAAVILLGLGTASVLATVATVQWKKAVTAEATAKSEATNARLAESKALEQEGIAKTEAMNARIAEQKALKQEGIAKTEAMNARVAESRALEQEGIAKTEAMNARIAERKAVDEQLKAEAALLLAENRKAELELAAYPSNVTLALGQIQQNDAANADATLDSVLQNEFYETLVAKDKLPKLRTWALNRVDLLSNRELLSEQAWGERLSAVAFAESANVGVVAVETNQGGKLQIVEFDGQAKQLKPVGTPHVTDVPIDGLAISPAGDEVIYSLVSANGDSAVYTWSLTGGQPAAVAQAERRELQGFAMTPEKVVGGINGGLWVWSRDIADWQESSPTKIKSVRGRLRSLQLLPESAALALAELNGRLFVHLVDLNGETNQAARHIQFEPGPQATFQPKLLSAVAYHDGKLILGTREGRLFTVALTVGDTNVGPDFQEVLPQLHQTAIQSIRVHADGTLLTTAIEPVVQVWKPSTTQLSGWQHDTFLAGTTDNVGGVAFMSNSSLVLGVGASGHSIVWDIERQKQRRQLRRLNENGQELTYDSPVLQVVASSDNRRAVSIHEDGTIDCWDLETGRTNLLPGDHVFSFVGHSPGATFIDMAIDETSGTLVTSALLPVSTADDTPQSGNDPNLKRTWEFCRWDLPTGKMEARWSNETETEQQISLLADGQLILFASDSETLIYKLDDAANQDATPIFRESLGSFFAVQNPSNKNVAMMVKRSGAVRIYDAEQNQFSSELTEQQGYALKTDDDVPLVGQWNPAGDRFYMVWASGRLTELAWQSGQISIVRDLRQQALSALGISLNLDSADGAAVGGIRLASRWQVDLKVRDAGVANLLYVEVRFPGAEGRTRLAQLAFPKEAGSPVAKKVEVDLGRLVAVLSDAETPQIDKDSLAALPVSNHQIVATRAGAQGSYFASADGTVYRGLPSGGFTAYGRPKVLAGAGNLAADRIVILHEAGVLWEATWDGQQWDWSPLPNTSPNAVDVAMSVDGKQWLVTYGSIADQSRELRISTGVAGQETPIPGAVCGAWIDNERLALVMADGTVAIQDAAGVQSVGKLQSAVGDGARSVHVFQEAWNDRAPNRWLVVHSQGEDAGSLEYFPLDPAAAAEPKPRVKSLTAGVSVLACSPTEGMLVTGGVGTVTVYFAAPSLDEYGTELFGLEGHAGAKLRTIAFSPDGKTTVTTDSESRLFGWMSEDRLNGVSTELSTTQAKELVQ
jgi:serine/threonine protein kinase/WD40 repeat protein